MASPTKNNNLSISFNLDLRDVHSDASSDSDAAGLQIDVSEVDSFVNTNKRSIKKKKLLEDQDTSFIDEMEEEIERQLDAKAAKSNLTATNVKNILRHVISNEHVQAMVNKKLNKGDDPLVFEPKLTRAKVKQLAMEQPNIPWPMTPIKNTSEVQILIQEEYPEDSSDEEYDPTNDQQSEDDRDMENSVGSDIDSQPSTPATPSDLTTELPQTPEVQYDEEGVFKIPNVPNGPSEEESIGYRTRSKLCLSETPLEHIAQEFIPPDITTDMYDWDDCDEYVDFLKEIDSQPIQQEDDPEEDDPEYNVCEDEDSEIFDKEEMRADRAVKISKKELNTLIAELDEFADQYSKQQAMNQEKEAQMQQYKLPKKKKSGGDYSPSTVLPVPSILESNSPINFVTCSEIATSTFSSSSDMSTKDINSETTKDPLDIARVENFIPTNPMVVLIPVLAEPELPTLVHSEQLQLLSVQLSQHVQLLAQQFVMNYKHPIWHQQSLTCKSNLESLKTLGGSQNSEFQTQNLNYALQLVTEWEKKLENEQFLKEYTDFLESEMKKDHHVYQSKRRYKPLFHPELIKIMSKSKALMHPQLLPETFPILYPTYTRNKYFKSEESLIVLGLEQFIPFIKSLPKHFKRDCDVLVDAIAEIKKYMMPTSTTKRLGYYIKSKKNSKSNNPIKKYFETGSVPKVIHKILKKYEMIAPIDQPKSVLTPIWRKYIEQVKKVCNEEMVNTTPVALSNKSVVFDVLSLTSSNNVQVPDTHELRNPIVNVLHNMPTLNTPLKQEPMGSDRSTVGGTGESDIESAKEDEEVSFPATRTRLRMTQPRLAKAENEKKLLAQSQTIKIKTGETNTPCEASDKDEDTASYSKGDDEDEIAELMLASTTIKKRNNNRKKTKQAREMENMKRLIEAENNTSEQDISSKFAGSFLEKMHRMIDPKDAELSKEVFKLILDYNTEIERINALLPNGSELSDAFSQNAVDTENIICRVNKLSAELYHSVCKKLKDYPELCSDFLLFLTPEQASLTNTLVEHTMLYKMRNFTNISQTYFAKQPSRIAKIMQAITQMVTDPNVTLSEVQNIMGAALKGHPLIMDLFLQCLPTGKPSESLFETHLFENLACPVGPHDKNKPYNADAPEMYENIELPAANTQEDPYGGDSCKCECHSSAEDSKNKSISEHCASCGTRFLNGRIYFQTSEGLRPAKITFPGADEEKQENISRVSLKPTEPSIPYPTPRKRRKTSKGESVLDDSSSSKPSTSKALTNKDEDILTSAKQTKKAQVVKSSKPTTPNAKEDKKKKSIKPKGEKKETKKDEKSEIKLQEDESRTSTDQTEPEETAINDLNNQSLTEHKYGENSNDSQEYDVASHSEKRNTVSNNPEKMAASTDSDSSIDDALSPLPSESWSMQDDKILLEQIQREYSEETFIAISVLVNKSVEEVKERCGYLLSLLEKIS